MLDQIDTLEINGYKTVKYSAKEEHLFFAQHNYHYPYSGFTEVAINGWYDTTLMNSCATTVAVWKRKVN